MSTTAGLSKAASPIDPDPSIQVGSGSGTGGFGGGRIGVLGSGVTGYCLSNAP